MSLSPSEQSSKVRFADATSSNLGPMFSKSFHGAFDPPPLARMVFPTAFEMDLAIFCGVVVDRKEEEGRSRDNRWLYNSILSSK